MQPIIKYNILVKSFSLQTRIADLMTHISLINLFRTLFEYTFKVIYLGLSIRKSQPKTTSYTQNNNNGSNYISFHKLSVSINGLFFFSSPTTIIKIIMSVVSNSIYRSIRLSKILNMFQVAFIHIISKLLKRVPQYFYTFSPIIDIGFIFTPTFHVAKYALKSTLSESVSRVTFFNSIQFKTTAGLRMILPKISTTNNARIAAITNTFPHRIPLFVATSPFNNKKSSYFLPSLINDLHMDMVPYHNI